MRKVLGVLVFTGLVVAGYVWVRSHWPGEKFPRSQTATSKVLSTTEKVSRAPGATNVSNEKALEEVKSLTKKKEEKAEAAKVETEKAGSEAKAPAQKRALVLPRDGKPAEIAKAVIKANSDWKTIQKIAEGYVDRRKYEDASRFMTKILLDAKDAKTRAKAKTWLDKLNESIILTPTPTAESTFYTVKPGDSLWKIARKFKTSIGLIMLVNRKSSTRIRPGDRLKIPKGDVTILVDKDTFTLTLLLDGMYIRQYRVGIGRYNKTPEGTFEVGSMRKKPIWYAPDGKVYAYGHPKNVLGTRWIGLKETPEYSGYGIHGTTQPDTIGKAVSNGCIRMRNEDVEQVFDLVHIGTKVIIRK